MAASDGPGIKKFSPIIFLALFLIFAGITISGVRDHKLVMGALERRDFQRLEELLNENPRRLRRVYGFTNGSKRNLLQQAVMNHDLEMATFLLEHGADVNAGSKSYPHPIELAVRKHDLRMAKLLLEAGGGKSLSDFYRKKLLEMAPEDQDILRMLGQGGE